MKRKCPKCGSIEESKFCTNCGQDLSNADVVRICPNCGAETTSKFCIQCGTKIDQVGAGIAKNTKMSDSINEKVELQNSDIKRKEEEEKQRIAKQKEEEEKRRIAKQKEEEEKQRIAKEKEEERQRKEKIRNDLRDKKKYEEALSYMEHADQVDDKAVAAEFFRRAEKKFDELLGWEDSEEKSLICARKAKLCEISVESKKLSERGEKYEGKPSDALTLEKHTGQESTKEATADLGSATSKGNSKSKIVIIAVLIGTLVIGGAVFAMTHGKAGNNNSDANASEESTASDEGEAFQGDLISIDDGPTIEWETGSAVLTNYQIEKSEYEGDCVNLYFDYSKTGGEDESFNSVLDVGVFQNGYELDEKSSLTTDAENNSYNQVKDGASITAARGFLLNDSSELTVVLTAYDKDYNRIVERTKITIPDDKAKVITGNKKYFEETGEKPIKDGVSIRSKTGEVKVTGYKWTEYEGEEMLILYFDFTNLLDEEQAFNGSDFSLTVFQNGIEQDSSGWTTSEAESHYFSQVEKDTTMHCAYSYSIPEKTDIEIKITCWTDGDEKTEEQVISIQ